MDNVPKRAKKIAEDLIEWSHEDCEIDCCDCDFYPQICYELGKVITMINDKKIEGED